MIDVKEADLIKLLPHDEEHCVQKLHAFRDVVPPQGRRYLYQHTIIHVSASTKPQASYSLCFCNIVFCGSLFHKHQTINIFFSICCWNVHVEMFDHHSDVLRRLHVDINCIYWLVSQRPRILRRVLRWWESWPHITRETILPMRVMIRAKTTAWRNPEVRQWKWHEGFNAPDHS